MATENKKSFILYTDQWDSIKLLPDLERGRLLTAVFKYVMTGEEISTKSTTGICFSFIKKQLQRDSEKYNRLVERNRQNILSRYKKSRLNTSTKSTSGKTGIPNVLDTVNDTDIKDIYDHYLSKSGTSEKLTDGRKTKLAARFKSYSPDQIKQAIDNCFADSFYSGKNDRGWRANFDYIIRNDEIVDKLLNLTPKREPMDWAQAAQMRGDL